MASENATPSLRCNACAKDILSNSKAVAASCYHIFCTDCAQQLIQTQEPCPLCEGVITQKNVRVITALQDASNCRLYLCGQAPDVVMDAALTATNFFVEQQRLNGMYANHRLQQRMDSIQAQCRKKLTAMQQAYQQAKQKCVQAMQQKNAIEQDNQELQQKYAQKAAQARNLQDMFKQLQQENEELKRRLHVRGSMGAAVGGRGVMGGLHGGSGSGSGRHPSPFGGGPTQMVTTVRQTKSVIELSPIPGSMQLLTGHGSAVVGSGGQRPRTPSGYAANAAFFTNGSPGGLGAAPAAPGQRPSTAGGMFAAGMGGSSRNGMGGGMGVGMGGGMRLTRGITGLDSPGQCMMSL